MYIELHTERLLLRPLNVSDLQTTNDYATDAENTRYMIFLPNKNVEETRNFLARVSAEWQKDEPSFYDFAIVYGSLHVGAVSVSLNDDKTEGVLGWILNKKYWKKGFATESAFAIKEFAIHQLKVKRLVAYCDSRNLNSAHVMEKIGLSVESKGERQYFDQRGLADELKYSCVVMNA
jgi:Acetyltransferases, including N-acetylases of ribosomal proteins